MTAHDRGTLRLLKFAALIAAAGWAARLPLLLRIIFGGP
jgi:hypothetical protein